MSLVEDVETLAKTPLLSDPGHDDVDPPEPIPETATSDGESTFALTDSGNSEHFAQQYGEHVIYDHRRGRWLLWKSHRWVPDADAEIRRLAKAAVRQRFTDADACEDHNERSRRVKWALSSESKSRLDALLALAQAEHPIADAGDQWDQHPYLLGVPNGVIDLRTGTLRAGHRDDRMTMQAAVPFDPEARCPRWAQFILEIFHGDQELAAFVQRALGYSLSGATIEQCLFVLYGTGANGKGSLVNTIMRLLSDYASNMPFSTLELHQRASIPNDLAALVGRRFVVASETNDGTRLNESRVKALTGCDPLTARFLHGEFFTFEPVAKFWLSVNHKPIVRDDSHGFWRRIRLIPFSQRFALNPALAEELRTEGTGILAWLVRGCLAWQEQGLNPPPTVLKATEEYEKDSDALAAFLDEACDLVPTAETKAKDLFAQYKQWADGHSLSDKERLTNTAFGRKMSERFSKDKGRDGAAYKGVSLRTL